MPIPFFLDVPDHASFLGAETYVQGLFWDVGDQLPEEDLRLTNGVRIVAAGS